MVKMSKIVPLNLDLTLHHTGDEPPVAVAWNGAGQRKMPPADKSSPVGSILAHLSVLCTGSHDYVEHSRRSFSSLIPF